MRNAASLRSAHHGSGIEARMRRAPAPATVVAGELLCTAGALFVIVALFAFDFLAATVGFPAPREAVLGSGAVLSAAGLGLRAMAGVLPRPPVACVTIVGISIAAVLVQGARGFAPQDLTLALSPIVATTLMAGNRRVVQAAIVATAVVSVAGQLYEYWIGHFLYVLRTDEIALDERESMGAAGQLRTKGLFGSSISATAFLAFAFLIRPGLLTLLCLAAGSVVALGRNGQLFTIFAAASYYARPAGRRVLLRLVPLALIAVALLVSLADLAEPRLVPSVLDRFGKAFDLNDSSNLARLYFWQLGWALWAAHDSIPAILLGIPDELGRVGLRGIESSVLSVGIEYGLVGITLYAFGLVRLIRDTSIADGAMLPAYGGLLVMITTVSVLKALGFGSLFWFLVLRSEAERARKIAAGASPSF